MSLFRLAIGILLVAGPALRAQQLPTPAPSGTFYIGTLQRIAGRDYMLYIDIDPSDGRLPIVAQKIESECYPSSRASATR